MFDLEIIKENIENYSTNKICEIVVSCRYLSLDKEISIICMKELSRRRIKNIDNSNFEDIIEQKLKEMPALDFKIPDLVEILSTIKNISK